MGRKKKPVDKEIGIRLRNIRKKYLDLSQEEFALKYGYSVSTIRAWESGTRNIPLDIIQKVCNDSDCSLTVILGVEDACTILGKNLMNHWDNTYDENKILFDYLESIRIGVDFTPGTESDRSYTSVVFDYELFDIGNDMVIRRFTEEEWSNFKEKLAQIIRGIITL